MSFFVIFLLLISSLIYFLLKKKILGLIKYSTKFFEISDFFFTFKIFNKRSNNIEAKLKNRKKDKNFAIIIQGPILSTSNFTLETINLYSENFPNIPIILSSWEEDIKKVEGKLNKNIHLVSNTLPTYSGYRNINLQAITTINAIKLAKKLNYKYVLKTRTDTRLYSKNFVKYLMNTIKFYKLKNTSQLKQKERIIGTSFTIRYRLYGFSDMILFGNTKDLYKYFDIVSEKKIEKKTYNFIIKLNFKDKDYFVQREFCPEIYFFSQFCEKIGKKIKWTTSDYINKLSNNFVIVDNNSLGVYWKKSNKFENHFSKTPMPIDKNLEFSFSDWFNYYCKNKKK